MKSYSDLRQEFRKESFRDILHSNIPKICCNCGSDIHVEYHHIVPLFRGGTNKLSNIVPLCDRCHKAVHYGQHVTKYSKRPDNTGRPRKATLTPESEEILWKWANGEIGARECMSRLGYGGGTHLKDLATYKEFIKKHNIQNIRNLYDVIANKNGLYPGRQTSTIFYTDGDREFGYYNPTL